MERQFIKNMEFSKALEFSRLVDYQPGRVVSLTLVQNEALTLTLFAFAKGEGVSTHSAPGDALVYILDGKASISIGEDTIAAKTGDAVVMPADIPHGLEADENFKMLLILVKK